MREKILQQPMFEFEFVGIITLYQMAGFQFQVLE